MKAAIFVFIKDNLCAGTKRASAKNLRRVHSKQG